MGANQTIQPTKKYLTTEAIIKFVAELDEQIENMVMCKTDDVILQTTDQDLYEALGTLNQEGSVNVSRLVKFLEVVHIESIENTKGNAKQILTPQRVDELIRVVGLGGTKDE
ncbi:MAG: hypothetical protein ACI8Y7_000797 [Candidatus Woesearchaeota archaeon]|jgi:hypothetical protein